ncbi:unnamed protein product [Allacma fusca]|uniref:Uncharacterized protein n=1 Tax=Allacma fusca TaxID=39272 RepID=A0A8J2Q7E4_9HEXA|nr:unnamed protein product [Allacma fusca]
MKGVAVAVLVFAVMAVANAKRNPKFPGLGLAVERNVREADPVPVFMDGEDPVPVDNAVPFAAPVIPRKPTDNEAYVAEPLEFRQ